jgi:hypothetical protein
MRCFLTISHHRNINLLVRKMSVLENAANVRNRIVWMDLEVRNILIKLVL